ncbi:hypothetical protein P8452_23156 [Trifolium repens]|nr:hypothetical protein P8452_23156 [Trifolium repens]
MTSYTLQQEHRAGLQNSIHWYTLHQFYLHKRGAPFPPLRSFFVTKMQATYQHQARTLSRVFYCGQPSLTKELHQYSIIF